MANKSLIAGGTDWTTPTARIKPTDLIDTVDDVNQNVGNTEKKTNEIISISCSTTTATTSLGTLTDTTEITLFNEGDNTIFVNFATTATTSGFPIFPNQNITILNFEAGTDFAGITSTGTSTLKVLAVKGEKVGQYDTTEIDTISATTTSANHTFTDTSALKDVIVANIGSADVYINFGTTATTSHLLLGVNEYLVLNKSSFDTISAITSSGTADVRLLGVY